MTKLRRAACVWLTGIMAATFVAGNVLAFADTNGSPLSAAAQFDTVNFTDVTGKVDVSGVALQNLSPSVLQNAGYATTAGGTQTVIVRLDSASLTDSVPDGESVTEYISSYAGSKKVRSIQEVQSNLLNSISSMGISYKLRYQYTAVTNAVAIEVDASQISAIKSIAGVKAAYVAQTYSYPQAISADDVVENATTNYSNVYSTGIYNSSEIIEKYGVDGSGMTVAILDTGLDYTHEAFSTMPQTVAMSKSYVSGQLNKEKFSAETRSAENGKTLTVDDVYVNAKVPFAYDYADGDADVYPSYSQHGTHVAGIVAGQADSYKDKNGNLVEEPFRGVAPNAQLVICKVFTDDFESNELGGATTENLVAALDDCVKLGVDVINMSLGTPSGFSSGFMDEDDEGQLLDGIYRTVKETGISLIVAASNEYSAGFGSAFGTNLATNPDSGTVGSPSTFDGAVSVASVNGQQAPFMVANAGTDYAAPIFYTESSDSNSVQFNFAKQVLGNETSKIFKYVVVGGAGQESNYSASVKALLKDENYPTIALVSRGTTTFEAKIRTAMNNGADAIIVYNNVAGSIGMSVGEIDNPIPAVSITMDAGTSLRYNESGRPITYGYIEVNSSYVAGPFMNEYSSWGATPDLKLKPDVTAHGGEITSTVAGGYDQLSGTSMASPNLAGFVALLKSYIKSNEALSAIHGGDAKAITRLVNQITMSTATTVYDMNGLPYSPRKQGSGLATLSNAFGTGAYLWTNKDADEAYSAEDNRPKIELGEDEDGVGKYTFSLYVTNFGSTALDFIADSKLFTETLSSDKLSVAEKAYFLNDIAPVWSISENGGASRPLGADEVFTVASGASAKITVTLELSQAEKNYITTSFPNGMFVEGFITLKSQTEGQCDLNLPFMGFYGDWEAAPMLDYSVYEIAESQQDKSLKEDEKLKEKVWATQAFANYYNSKYSVPMGSYLYTQDETAEQIYANPEHAMISRYNWYYGEDDTSNYLTTYQIRALYAGLLRNAAVVTYDLYDAETGELITTDNLYRLNKSYAGGGAATPSQVLLEFDPDELGLVNNGKYALDFYFYFNEEQYENRVRTEDNTFSMTFYVDYEAPILVDSRIRYVDHKDTTGREWQSVYLDLDIYDNTYAQSVILCVAEYEDPAHPSNETIKELRLVTDYITPVYNAVKNGTTTVTIDISDLMSQPEMYNHLFVQIDDYALNHRVLSVEFSSSSGNVLPSEFEIAGSTDIVLGVNETYKVGLLFEGNANISNFVWETIYGDRYVRINNGELFGVLPTREGAPEEITIKGANGSQRTITVTVVDNGKKLTFPTLLSFGMIRDNLDSLVKATGTVKVNAGTTFTLEVFAEPWYYDPSDYQIVWSSSNSNVASVDENGNVTVYNAKGSAAISAVIYDGSILKCSANVTLAVQDPFTVSSNRLTKFSGTQEVVEIPADKNITTIGEEAFKDNSTMKVVIIPATVTSIDVKAFLNCTALEEVYFVQKDAMEIPTSKLATVMRYAFSGCTSLKKVDLSNCKTITLDRSVFEGCTSLEEVVKMQNIGTMLSYTFAGCTSLTEIDITGMHVAGSYVFAGCTNLTSVKTGFYTAIGENMFNGCTSLEEITINAKTVEANAFKNCISLTTVSFGVAENGEAVSATYVIGKNAFDGCLKLKTINYNGNEVTEIGDMAFANCTALTSFAVPKGLIRFGDSVFENVNVTYTAAAGSGYTVSNGAIYDGTTLLIAPKTVPSSFSLTGVTAIAPYAFAGCTFAGSVTLPSTLTSIGEGAFANSNLGAVTIPASVTEISAYAFKGTGLSTVKINKEVTSIGEGAFMDCASLATVTFEEGSALVSIGDAAFFGCRSLKTVALPDGVKTLGSAVFQNCTGLTEATVPSVTGLGSYAFFGCVNLEKVTFGDEATTVGEFTFGDCVKLNSVVIGSATEVIGAGAFIGCISLEEIELASVTEIGEGAFYGCTALKTVDLGNVKYIGDLAFYGCSLSELNLTNAKVIGVGAFYLVEFERLSIPAVESIGSFAFFGGLEDTVELPTSVKTIGYGAFANSQNLTAFTLTGDGDCDYFVEDGVLYGILKTVTGERNSLELTAYPTAKIADSDENGNKTYSILEGTVTVKAYAMANLAEGAVDKVIIPYSVKTIGDAAFFDSGIYDYQFEAINAPVLLSDFYYVGEFLGLDFSDNSHYALFARNFEVESWYYVSSIINTDFVLSSPLKISYPSNGTGYDNYLYLNYFGTRVSLGEVMDDTTRELINIVKSFPSLAEIESWNSLPVSEENKTMATEFSALVISAHELYNILASNYQVELFGAENAQTLFDVESALKSVKAHFGIVYKATSLSLDASTAHKSVYTEGEKFSLKGLVLTVSYEDKTTELADMSKIILDPTYDRELSRYNTYVYVSGTGDYAGLRLLIPISVNEAGVGGESAGGSNGLVIGLAVGGSILGLILIAAAVILVLKFKFKVDVIGKIFKKSEKTAVVTDDGITGEENKNGENKEE